MKKYNIIANLIRVMKHVYDKATSAILFNGSIRHWFRTTVGVREGYLLSPTLFNIFLKRIMTDALEDHEGTVSIGGRTITNLCFADDIDGFIIIIINPLTTRVVGAPQMTLQPVFSIFPCSHLCFCLLCLLLPFIMPCKMVLAISISTDTHGHAIG